jgi:hypothetical protein
MSKKSKRHKKLKPLDIKIVSANEIEYYIRIDNKWVIDADINKENINTDESSVLCDMQKQCINVPGNVDDWNRISNNW